MTKTSKLLLFVVLSTLCAQVFSIRMSSTSASESLSASSLEADSSFMSGVEFETSAYTLTSIFPSALNLGCVNINTIANKFTSALTYQAGASSSTKSIIDTTVNTIVTALLNNDLTGDVAGSNACLGNFASSYITGNIDECSSMLLPDSGSYSVMAFNIPVPGGVCSAEEMGMAAFCVAMGTYNGLPSLSIQANAGTLSCLATAAGSGVGYAIATAIDAGLDTVSLGISLTSSFVKSTTIYTGKVESVQVSGNYYDYVSLEIDPAKFGLPDVFEISGSATRVIKVTDNAATWITKLSKASNVKDVAVDLFGDLSMLVAVELDLTLALAGKTFGLLPDLGPYTMGLATLYATTSSTTLESGQNLKAGVYTYVTANNILPQLMSGIVTMVVNKVGGILNTILSDFGISISDILSKLTPSASSSSNAVGFLVNTEEISLLVQTSVSSITTIVPVGGTITIQCYYRYSNNKFSCKLNMGSISKFFTGLLSDAVWVIKQASAFFDETGSAIAFAEKQLAAFTDKALQTTATNIQKGITAVSGYANDAANWAKKAVYQCGYKTVTDAVKCGTTAVTDSAKCGSSYVTDAAKCGTSYVTDAAKCGYSTVTDAAKCGSQYITDGAKCGFDSITDGAKCGYDTIKNCFKSLFKKCGKKAKSCQVAKSCSIAKTCTVSASCNISNTCSWPNTCNIASTCNIANNC